MSVSGVMHSCVLCGYIIGDHDNHDAGWKLLFRILYSIDDRVAITGVGLALNHEAVQLEAPLEYGARWDTSESRVEIGVINQWPVDDRHGFPFHEACWSLLEQAYSPSAIPLRRLLDVCHSLPFSPPTRCLTWGHDFGGLISADDDSYPWEDIFVDQKLDFAKRNPYFVPEIQRLPCETPSSPGVPEAEASIITRRTDIFAKLPLEVICCISHHLPTVDYLNARLVIRSFYPVFNTQMFWASRFWSVADRSWVFESQNWVEPCNWLWIYRQTAKGSPGMKNRRRIWQLIETVKPILRLEWFEPISSSIANVTSTEWLQAAGDLRHKPQEHQPWRSFGWGCRQVHEKQVDIPPSQLSQLAFTLIQIGSDTYITGIGFLLTRRETIRLGYMADGLRVVVLNAKCLTGFNLAVGSRGVQAMQCILNGNQESSWIGYPDNAPRTKRLNFAGPITSIKVAFDDYKMVSLAATSIHPTQGDLRTSAFWYPKIPDPSLYLNEGDFTARDIAMSRYDPVYWTKFGGPSGKYLRLLAGISCLHDSGCLRAIEFHYNSDDVPLECRKVGRCASSKHAKTMHFEIDGPGGEVIDSLTVYMLRILSGGMRYDRSGVVQSFKVSTNFGRSYRLGSTRRMKPQCYESFKKNINCVEGSTMTGLYWTQHHNSIISLGAISEMV